MKLDIGEKAKTYHYELEKDKGKVLAGKKIGDEIDGAIIDAKFAGFKFKITGLSNNAGFPGLKRVEGTSLKRLLLTKASKGMSGKRSKKKKIIQGLRLKKTVRGNEIAKDIAQVNLKVVSGSGLDKIIVKTGEKKEGEEKKE